MNTLVGVGVGPGDPGLVTVRAADLLEAADVVFVPATGPAEQTVLFYTEVWRVECVPWAGAGWAVDPVAAWFAAHPGGTAVFATSGDPGGDFTFDALAAAVRDRLGELIVRLGRVPWIRVDGIRDPDRCWQGAGASRCTGRTRSCRQRRPGRICHGRRRRECRDHDPRDAA